MDFHHSPEHSQKPERAATPPELQEPRTNVNELPFIDSFSSSQISLYIDEIPMSDDTTPSVLRVKSRAVDERDTDDMATSEGSAPSGFREERGAVGDESGAGCMAKSGISTPSGFRGNSKELASLGSPIVATSPSPTEDTLSQISDLTDEDDMTTLDITAFREWSKEDSVLEPLADTHSEVCRDLTDKKKMPTSHICPTARFQKKRNKISELASIASQVVVASPSRAVNAQTSIKSALREELKRANCFSTLLEQQKEISGVPCWQLGHGQEVVVLVHQSSLASVPQSIRAEPSVLRKIQTTTSLLGLQEESDQVKKLSGTTSKIEQEQQNEVNELPEGMIDGKTLPKSPGDTIPLPAQPRSEQVLPETTPKSSDISRWKPYDLQNLDEIVLDNGSCEEIQSFQYGDPDLSQEDSPTPCPSVYGQAFMWRDIMARRKAFRRAIDTHERGCWAGFIKWICWKCCCKETPDTSESDSTYN